MPQLDFITLVPIVLGILLLFVGRKVFWLFIGAVAFVVVMDVLPRYIQHQESLIFFIALGVGGLASVAGYFLQKVALRLAGFIAGGFVFFSVSESFSETLPWWMPFVIGGILGAVLLSFLIEWALMVLSSITGAFLISHQLELEPKMQLAVLVVLAVLGFTVQAKMKAGGRKKGHE